MQSTTGNIKEFEDMAEAAKEGYDVPLTKAEAKDLKKIEPKDRIPFSNMTKNQKRRFRKKIRQGKL